MKSSRLVLLNAPAATETQVTAEREVMEIAQRELTHMVVIGMAVVGMEVEITTIHLHLTALL